MHDVSREGPADRACSGCNLAVCLLLVEYADRVANGPEGLDLMPTCVIATTANEYHMTKQLKTLRRFRDEFMLKHGLEGVVDTYYRHGPIVADFLARHNALKPVARILLTPLAAGARLLLSVTKDEDQARDNK